MDYEGPNDKRRGSDEPSAPSLAEIGTRVREDLVMLRDAAVRRRGKLLQQASQFVNEHPIAALGAAFSVGFLISGALLSRTTGRLIGLGARFYLAQLVRGGLASSAVDTLRHGARPVA